MFRYRQFILGLLLGGWISFLLVRCMIFQEFAGLEAAGNASYIQLRNELLDDVVLYPLCILIPLTFFTGLMMGISTWVQKKSRKH